MVVVTAAQRVFDVTELCETILLALADDIDTNKEPAIAVFAVQRVCKTFKATITGSKELRRLMWLDKKELSFEEARDNPCALHGRISWLFEQLLNPLEIRYCEIKSEKLRRPRRPSDNAFHEVTQQAKDTHPNDEEVTEWRKASIQLQAKKTIMCPEGNPKGLLTSFIQPEASWREIRTPLVKGVEPVICVVMSVAPSYTSDVYSDAVYSWMYATLGGYCDEYVNMFQRSDAEHAEAFKWYLEEASLDSSWEDEQRMSTVDLCVATRFYRQRK